MISMIYKLEELAQMHSTRKIIQGGKDGWYKMLGSDAKPSQKYQLNKQGGSLTPNVSNINILDKK